MMRKAIYGILMVLMASLALPSCLKETDDDKTIVLFGEEGYVKNFKRIVGLSPDTLNALQVMSVTLDDSQSAPPDIRGEYRFANRVKIYPTSGSAGSNDTVFFRFGGDFEQWNDYLHGQHHFITHCDIKIPGLDLNSASYHTDTAYVKGQGDVFFAYFQRYVDVEAPITGDVLKYQLRQGIVISGKMQRVDGKHYNITDARLAFYNRDVKILNGWNFTPEVLEPIQNLRHTLYVYKDSDNLTEVNLGERPFIDWNE